MEHLLLLTHTQNSVSPLKTLNPGNQENEFEMPSNLEEALKYSGSSEKQAPYSKTRMIEQLSAEQKERLIKTFK